MHIVSTSDSNKANNIKPKVSFTKSIDNTPVKVDVYTFTKKHFDLLELGDQFIQVDELNPRIKSNYSAISNADLDTQIIRNGQVTEALGRYILDANGDIQYSNNGIPLIGILDGSRRFDCCFRNNQPFSIIVGQFNDKLSSSIVYSCVDAQQDLSSLELGIMIGSLEISQHKKLKTKELKKLLPYEKSKFAISHARKAMRLYDAYPKLFSVFPVLSFVGKQTISKLGEVVEWAVNNYQMETLLAFLDTELFDYETEESLLSFEELQNYNSKTNNVIIEAMRERIGVTTKPKTKKIVTDITDHISYELKLNNKEIPRSEKLIVIEAELTDEERSITERFLLLLTDEKISKRNSDVSLTDQFEMLFRQLG